jgi:hypothetical protein
MGIRQSTANLQALALTALQGAAPPVPSSECGVAQEDPLVAPHPPRPC